MVCEPFTQWVLEDDFPSGRPAYQQAGAQLVNEVEPYELMKLRLLNATLLPVPGIDLDAYKHTPIERFSNPQRRESTKTASQSRSSTGSATP